MHAQSGQMITDRERGRKTERERERVGGPVSLCLSRSTRTEDSGGQETRGLIHTHIHTLTLLCTFFLSHSGFVI